MKSDHVSQSDSLNKIAAGGLVFLLGTIAVTGLQFLIGIILVRSMDPSQFGLIALANTIVSIFVIFAVLGFGTGLPRIISKQRQQGESSETDRFAGAAIILSTLISILLAFMLYRGGPFIERIFDKPGIADALREFSMMIPPLSVMSVFTAVFRGMGKTMPKVLYQDLALNFSRLVVFSGFFFLGMGYLAFIRGYVFTAWAVFIAYLLYSWKKIALRNTFPISRRVAVEILAASLPLMGVALINNLIGWTGSLSLGWLSSFGEVGNYAATQRLAITLTIPLTALAFVYLPVATEHYGESFSAGVKELYATTSKWVFVATIPFAIFFLIDAPFIVTLLFGAQYRNAAIVLRILAAGYFVHVIPGPNNITLVAVGESGAVLAGTTLACLTAVCSCFFLAPLYGAAGAAAGISAARIVSNIFASFVLYSKTRIHPFSKEYIRILFVSFPVAGGLCGIARFLVADTPGGHLLIFLLTCALTIVAFFAIRGITKYDIAFIKIIERRIGGRTRFSDWLIARL